MGIIFSILLILLGLVGAEGFFAEKFPPARAYIAKIAQYREPLGFVGFLLGILSVFQFIVMLQIFHLSSVPVLMAFITTLLTLSLGLILGLDFLRKNLKDGNAPIILKVETVRTKLLPYQKEMGIAAAVLGVVYLLMNLI